MDRFHAFPKPSMLVAAKLTFLRECLHEPRPNKFVSTLLQGLFTKSGERGVRLSGGQTQRTGITRALYRDPAILIFD